MTTNQKHASRASAPEVVGHSVSEAVVTPSDYFVWKGWMMRVIGVLLLIMVLPIILLLALLVRCTSSGPALYRQKRIGKNGKVFSFCKIRSMYDGAEQITGPVWCLPGDSRITPVGRVLRLLHLDELPQLFNVVRGEMCLVGPRPERPEIIERLRKDILNYDQRQQVLPGITGLAQINLPPDVDLESVRAKHALDLEYIQTASLGLDFRMLLCTALRILCVRGGYAPRWLKLTRPKPFTENQPSIPDIAITEVPHQIGATNCSDVAVADDNDLRSTVIVPIVESAPAAAANITIGSASKGNTKTLSKKHPR